MPGVVRLLALLAPLLLGSARGFARKSTGPRAQMMKRGSAGGEPGWAAAPCGPLGGVWDPEGPPGRPATREAQAGGPALPPGPGRAGRASLPGALSLVFRSRRLCRREPLPLSVQPGAEMRCFPAWQVSGSGIGVARAPGRPPEPREAAPLLPALCGALRKGE